MDDDDEVGAGAHRCSTCGVDWPATTAYIACPECGTRTWHAAQRSPLDADLAARRKREADFERYCEQREAKRTRAFVEHMNAVCGPLEAPAS